MKRAIVFLSLAFAAVAGQASVASAQGRLALVIGQGAYEGRPLPTTVNDAGLIAQTLTSAGFEVIQARDLGANDLRSLVRDFLDKAQDLEPGSTVMIYLAGHGVQLEGDNYLLPVDARIERDVDVPIEGFRLSDLVRSLERSPAQVRVIVADIARDYPLGSTGEPIAKGLALMEPPAGFLMAFSSAPNIAATDGQGPYGAYATALAEMIRQPGLALDEVFARARLRTHESTNGQQIPWHSANLGQGSFVFFEQTEAAPLVREVRRIEEAPADEAYAIAVERDTIQGYQAFLRRYPDHRLARRGDGAPRRPPRSHRLAPHTGEQHAGSLLDLSAPLPEWPACAGQPTPARAPFRTLCSAGGFRGGDLRGPAPALAGGGAGRRGRGRDDHPRRAAAPGSGLSSAVLGRGRGLRHDHPRAAAATDHGGRPADPDGHSGPCTRPAAPFVLPAHCSDHAAWSGRHSRCRPAGLRRSHGRRARSPPAPWTASRAAGRSAAAWARRAD
nr:caspase family protein [Microvirga tunisiensis]